MSRSRSSFDLSGAIATATSLSVVVPEDPQALHYRGVPLVSFGVPFGPPPGGLTTRLPPPVDAAEVAEAVEPAPTDDAEPLAEALPAESAPVGIPIEAPAAEAEQGPADNARRPPRLPDLSDVKSPTVRCERIIAWIVEAVGASEVFIADFTGLPIAGAVGVGDTRDPASAGTDTEARLAATGVVAAAVAHLAAALPGNSSALFELHVGDGPFFQLVGFEAGAANYVVGFHRATPLGFRQAHAVRLACRHALTAGTPAGNGGAEPGGEA
jgi:hypothetical protein